MTESRNTIDPISAMMEKRASRRGFFIGTGTAGVALVAAACGSDSRSPSTGTASSPSAPGSSGGSGDAAIATTAASLEVLAVGTYKGALDAATAGKLGTVPPAVATFVQTAMGHHQAALDRWNGILTAAGAPKVSTPPADLKQTVDTAFAKVTDATGAAKLALLLEQTAADTYLSAIPSIKNKDAVTLAGALQSVDQEHSAILLYVLGQYPVPDVFQKTDKAYAGTGAGTSGSPSSGS